MIVAIPINMQVDAKATKIVVSEKQRNFDKEFRKAFNKYRKSLNVKGLKSDNALIQVSRTRAKEISKNFSHTRPKNKSLIKLCVSKGARYKCYGEILAKLKIGKTEIHNNQEYKSIVNMTIAAWKKSHSHNAAMINNKYSLVGTSFYTKDGYLYICTIFAG